MDCKSLPPPGPMFCHWAKIELINKLKNIKKEQKRDSFPEYGVSFPNPNFAEFAKTVGGLGFRIKDPKELYNALKKAFNSNKATIVDILIDPEKLAPSTKRVD